MAAATRTAAVAPAVVARPTFEVAGNLADDIQPRREVKYALPGADPGTLSALLEGPCRRVEHGGRVSVVRSIYFDDLALSACWENLLGAGKRRKVRLRWYGDVAPPAEFFFEVKWRESLASGKWRRRVRADRPLAELAYDEIVAGLGDALPADLAEALRRRPEPVALVEYRREYFVARHGPLRVTLDHGLVFHDQTGARRPTLGAGTPMHDYVVLEGKAPVGREAELRALLAPLRPRATRSSKYIHACRRLGLTRQD